MKSPYSNLRTKVILDLLEKFPEAPSKTLARIAKRDNSELFVDIEDARTIVRFYRGQHGKHHRDVVKFTKYYTHELA